MNFPIEDLLCIIISYATTTLFSYIASRLAEKYNWGLARVFEKLPSWTGIIIFALVLLCVPFFCYGFTWGFDAYDFLKEGRVDLAVRTLLINAFGCFYTSIIVKDMPKRHK